MIALCKLKQHYCFSHNCENRKKLKSKKKVKKKSKKKKIHIR